MVAAYLPWPQKKKLHLCQESTWNASRPIQNTKMKKSKFVCQTWQEIRKSIEILKQATNLNCGLH